ncbi:MAG: hypothetical protein WBA74_26800 [Cyclobacteriaceae bacterium]
MTKLGPRDISTMMLYGWYGKFVIAGFFLALILNILNFDPEDSIDFKLNYSSTEVADGYIVNLEDTNVAVDGQRMTKYYYSFSVGDEVFSSQSYEGNYLQVDDKVLIEYLPENPEYSRILDSTKTMSGLFLNYLLGLILLAFTVMLIFHTLKIIRFAKIISKGRITDGKKISSNATNTVINNRPVYKITYEYEVDKSIYNTSCKSVDHEDYKNTERVVYSVDNPEKSLLFTNLPIPIRRLIH